MDISDIHLIKTILQTGSLSEASRQLHQSQPTLSRKLFRLEDELGTKLFERSAKGLTPTDIANYIVAQANPLEEQLAAIRRHVELSTQFQTGSIRIGIGPIIEQIMIPDVLAEFVQTTGDVEITVVTETDEALMEMFDASDIDIIIGPFDHQAWSKKGMITRPMISDDIIAVARQDHPIFEAAEITPDLLTRYPLLAPKTRGTVTQKKGAPTLPAPKVASDNYDLLRRLTLKLDAFCGGPRLIFQKHLDGGDLREINIDLAMFWQSYLIVRPETYHTPIISHFVDLCEIFAQNKELNR